MTSLIAPDPARYAEWADLIADSHDPVPHGSGMWAVRSGTTPAGFAEHLEVSRQYADPAFVVPDGASHMEQFWITDDAGALVGFLSLRTEDSPRVLGEVGHIGYSVRVSRQREGHASAALALGVARAHEVGVDRVLVTCDVANVASAATIESQGGVLESVIGGKRRYWIT